MTVIGVVTVGRSDFSILRPVMQRIEDDPDLQLAVIAAGMHLSPEHGLTIREIESAGFAVSAQVEMLVSSDTAEGTAKSMGLGLIGFGQLFGRWRPDLLLVMGDRFEMFAAAASAVPFRIPLAHLHGGELSEGAMDDGFRHAITKLSHLHFVSTAEYRRRVIQLGEVPDHVMVSGAPALDNLRKLAPLSRGELERRFGLDLAEPPLLVTSHPTTLELENSQADTHALLDALAGSGRPVVLTAPNADPAGRLIREMIEAELPKQPRWKMVMNFGGEAYYSMLRHAGAMVGNSSSGIIEAASFGLPVVNVGNRQRGRLTGANVIHVPATAQAIADGITRALSEQFRAGIAAMANPYGAGEAADIIVRGIKRHRADFSSLISKRFCDAGGAW